MSYRTQNGRTSKRGAFLNGIWHCDCEPRMPASKFQTKNGGKNHGRWFYTCPKSQPKRCGFFLWQDDAKVREGSPVSGNSRSEPEQVPQTPKTPISNPHVPLTPQSRGPPLSEEKAIGLTDTPTSKDEISTPANEDSFEWPSSDEDQVTETAAQAPMPPPVETPRKTPRMEEFTSPGKRSYKEMQSSGTSTWHVSIPSNDDDVFITPTTSNRFNGLLSPSATPTTIPSQLENQSQPVGNHAFHSTLASEVLKILAPIPLNPSVQSQLVELLDRYDLRTQGIAKGRDITRLGIQSRERKIAELQARIAGLEAELQTSRTVIAHLKQDIGAHTTSPKKGRGRFVPRSTHDNS